MTPTEIIAVLTAAGSLMALFYNTRTSARKSEVELLRNELTATNKDLADERLANRKRRQQIERLYEYIDLLKRHLIVQRDENALMRTVLHQHAIEVPEIRRHGDLTKPLPNLVLDMDVDMDPAEPEARS